MFIQSPKDQTWVSRVMVQMTQFSVETSWSVGSRCHCTKLVWACLGLGRGLAIFVQLSIYRLNLVKIWFSKNTKYLIFFQWNTFLIVHFITKLPAECGFLLKYPLKMPKLLILEFFFGLIRWLICKSGQVTWHHWDNWDNLSSPSSHLKELCWHTVNS